MMNTVARIANSDSVACTVIIQVANYFSAVCDQRFYATSCIAVFIKNTFRVNNRPQIKAVQPAHLIMSKNVISFQK